jgi:hypothetical protein
MVSALKILTLRPARLELLRQADVNKATGRVVGEICVVGGGVRVGRILTENVVTAERDRAAVKDALPGGQSVVGGLRSCALGGTAILRSGSLFRILDITGHWTGFDWRNEVQTIGALNIKKPCLLDVMDVVDGVAGEGKRPVLVKAIQIVNRAAHVKIMPGPIDSGKAFPLQVTIAGANKTQDEPTNSFSGKSGVGANWNESRKVAWVREVKVPQRVSKTY